MPFLLSVSSDSNATSHLLIDSEEVVLMNVIFSRVSVQAADQPTTSKTVFPQVLSYRVVVDVEGIEESWLN